VLVMLIDYPEETAPVQAALERLPPERLPP
jgi:hypothetical protein